jgi:hypothetical protein
MALNVCARCTTKFSIGALHCPQCGNADYYEEGSMPKIRREGGATYPITVEVAGPELPTSTAGGAVGEVVLELPDGPVDITEYVAEDEGPNDAPDGPYAGMLRADLQSLCGDRGLATYGSKAELIARLTAADEAAAPGSDDLPL